MKMLVLGYTRKKIIDFFAALKWNLYLCEKIKDYVSTLSN